MKIFVTGATGFIGRKVTEELLKHNHEVLGLARNDKSASLVTEAGGKPHKGDIEDLDSLKSGAAASDGVIHLAFHHEYMFTDFPKACAVDRAAIQAMGDAMAGSGKPQVIASGSLIMMKGKLAHEDDEPDRNMALAARIASADLVRKLSKEINIRGMEMRFAPTVHGAGDHGFVPMLADAARKVGHATYIDDGMSVWPAVHVKDAASCCRLAVETGKAGASYHAIGEQGVRMKDIQELIGKRLQLPVESKSQQDAAALEALGFFAHIIGLDNPTSNEKTRKELGWQPREIGLLEDMEKNYFG